MRGTANRWPHGRGRCGWLGLAALTLALCAVAAEPLAPTPAVAAPEAGLTLAWARFTDAPERYTEVPYHWLGRCTLRLVAEVRPLAGQALALCWGAKGDDREATLTVNGVPLEVRGGGYNGFRWLTVPVPATALTGPRYEVEIRRTSGKPAFLAEVRVLGPKAVVPRPDLSRPDGGLALTLGPALAPPAVEAFPEMRAGWDREPAAAAPGTETRPDSLFRAAERNGRRSAEALYRCRRFVDGWLAHADPVSGLIPRNLGDSRDLWNPRDAAADNYPFMVLTCALTDRELFAGRMLDMLRAETRLTSRLDRIPDDYRFSTATFASPKPNVDAIVFGGAEYVKDGLIPLTEWLGPSPWSERMTGIVEDIWKHARVETPAGRLPTLNFEVNGDLLQACSRLFWFTGDRRHLEWAIRLGDYYLLGDHHPTRDLTSLRLIDHGCEVVNGLSELYLAVATAQPEKKRAYEAPLHALFDRILEVGRNEHGQLYVGFNPKTGEHSPGICDTWGYNYDGFYTVWLVDRTEAYREAVRHVLRNLQPHYTGHDWGGADGYADSLEGAINLLNREPDASAEAWVDSEIRSMWGIQKPDGVIEGWHGDGNVARTSIMYALWRSQGLSVQPWRPDLRCGAVRDGDALYVSLAADRPWEGRLVFDRPRHRDVFHLPLDYPRINQFPEWFTVTAEARYQLAQPGGGEPATASGRELAQGWPLRLPGGGTETRLAVTREAK